MGYAGQEGMGSIHKQLCDHELEDAIVRIRPTGWIGSDAIEAVVRTINEGGAFAVKVMPCPPKGEVVVGDAERQPRRSLREVVAEMVDQAKGVDVNALRDMVESVMDQEGL